MNEAFITVHEQIIEAQTGTDSSSAIVVGGIIMAPTGPLITEINTPAEFIDKLTLIGALKPSDHMSMVNAYRLSQTCKLILSRAIPSGVNQAWFAFKGTTGVIKSAIPTTTAAFWFTFNNINLEAPTLATKETLAYVVDKVGKTLNFTYTDPKGNTTSQIVSMEIDSLDSNGASNYINILNDLFPITLEVGVTELDFPSATDGSFINGKALNVPTGTWDSTVATWAPQASNKLMGQEFDLIDVVTDFGFPLVAMQNGLFPVAVDQKSELIVSTPYSADSTAKVIAHADLLTTCLSDRTVYVGQAERSAAFTGFPAIYGGSTVWIEALAKNKIGGKEFAPNFGTNHAVITLTSPNAEFDKTERNALLAKNIITAKTFKGVTSWNDNSTFQANKKIPTKESQIRLAFNKISREVSYLMIQFEGEENTSQTRSKVEDVLNAYFDTIFKGLLYGPKDFTVLCAKANNPDASIAANELHVKVQGRYTASTKYIDILNEAYPVGVTFS